MRVGIVYDRLGDTAAPVGAPPDWDAEFEPEETISAIEHALRGLGHEPVRIGNARALLAAVAAGRADIDVAVNIAEGYGSRNREAQAPVLLDLAGVPYVGSDALTLSLSLDKHMTKAVLATLLDTPPWCLARPGEPPPDVSDFPVFVKPRYEGTAKGIGRSSRCETAAQMRSEIARQHALYRQDLIVESFVEGAEYTVGVVGEPAVALPVLQRATELESGIGAHALDRHDEPAAHMTVDVLGVLTPALEGDLQGMALRAHRALECRDFSRSDFRVDHAGRAWFLEINPLPTLAPDGTFAILAELSGRPYPEFLAEIIGAAIDRAVSRAR
jgi:D-alanine-D-alanine ligase